MNITNEKTYTISDISEEDYFLLLSSLNVLQQQWEQVKPSLPTVGYDRLVKFLEQLRCHIDIRKLRILDNQHTTKEGFFRTLGIENETKTNS